MQWNASTSTASLPFNRFVLVVSVVVVLVDGLVTRLITSQLFNTVFQTALLPTWPVEALRFASLTYLTTTLAALYALYLGNWDGARVPSAFSFPSIVPSLLAALVTVIQPGAPLIMWLYALL